MTKAFLEYRPLLGLFKLDAQLAHFRVAGYLDATYFGHKPAASSKAA